MFNPGDMCTFLRRTKDFKPHFCATFTAFSATGKKQSPMYTAFACSKYFTGTSSSDCRTHSVSATIVFSPSFVSNTTVLAVLPSIFTGLISTPSEISLFSMETPSESFPTLLINPEYNPNRDTPTATLAEEPPQNCFDQ